MPSHDPESGDEIDYTNIDVIRNIVKYECIACGTDILNCATCISQNDKWNLETMKRNLPLCLECVAGYEL